MRRNGVYAIAVLLAGVVSCRDATGPLVIDGTWRFTFVDMDGTSMLGPLTCQGTSFDFVIAQTGSSFSGQQTGTASLVCTSEGHPAMSSSVAGETIPEGQVSGNRVTFHLGSVTGEHSASVSGAGDTMSGAATWDFRPGNDIVLRGRFVAERK